MTRRSIFAGIAGAAVIAAVTYFNDMVMQGTYLIGNYLPGIVFGMLILFLLTVNPLLGRFSRRGSFTGGELGVVVALLLFGCYAPGRGLGHYFTTFLMLPHHHVRTSPGWRGEPAAIAPEQVTDWRKLAEALQAAQAQPPGRALRRAWERLPGDARPGSADPEDAEWQGRLLAALNAAIADPAFHEGLRVERHAPEYVHVLAHRDPASLAAEDHARFNRGLIDAELPDALRQRRAGSLELVPPRMLADVSRDTTRVLDGFVTGLAQGDKRISPLAVPWRAWWRTLLLFWGPLLIVMSLAVIGLALVLHRQWSSHEHLPYPTVEFARALLPEPGQAVSPTFRSRLFWVGALLVFGAHMLNYAAVWWPEYVIPVRLSVNFGPLQQLMPAFRYTGWIIFNPPLIFTAVGLAYFLANDVSLAMGVAPYVYSMAEGIAISYGLSFGGRGMLVPCIDSFLYAGGYVGMFCVLAYSGRHYYRMVFMRSIGLPARDPVEPHAVAGGRMFLVCGALFVLMLMGVGVEAPLAILYALGSVMIFTVISRLLAEAGAFFVHAYFYPCALLWGFLGATAVGREQLLLLAMVSSLLLIDPREAIMPFAVSAFQLAERVKLRVGRVARWGSLALVISFIVSVPVALYWLYQYGAFRAGDGWTQNCVPRFAFDRSAEVATTLEAQGSVAISQGLHGFGRFLHAVPEPSLVTAFATTFGLVLLFAFLRRRFARWPLHPIMFLVLGTWQSRHLGFSFLIGWAIKKAVTKYGGAQRYQAVKPLMIGLITGEVVAALVPVLVGTVYYFVTGTPPKAFRILPG